MNSAAKTLAICILAPACCISSATGHKETRIGTDLKVIGLWEGPERNSSHEQPGMVLLLSTNGHGALMYDTGRIGLPSAFTFSMSNNFIRLDFKENSKLTGTLEYLPKAGKVLYKPSIPEPRVWELVRSTNATTKRMMFCIVGATNQTDAVMRLGHFYKEEYPETIKLFEETRPKDLPNKPLELRVPAPRKP